MSQRLPIGETLDGKRFTLPADVSTQTTAILGIRESGKTNTAGVLCEELLRKKQQVVIVDPTNAWWGLKSSADGKSKGFPIVILGGPRGDLPLEEGDGETLADFVVESRASVVLSLRHLRKGAQKRFVTVFAERLYHRKGDPEFQDAMTAVFDEASTFIPQKVGGAEAQMVGAMEDLVRKGRSSGIGVVLIDQRAASVNKDVLTQLEVLVAHRHTSPQDRKALKEWIEQHDSEQRAKEFLAELAGLKQGVAWFWSPVIDVFERVQVRKRETFDSSRTPKPGERQFTPTDFAKVDLEELKTRLGKTIEAARANDPKELKKQIAGLEAQLRKTSAAAPAVDGLAIEIARAEVHAEWRERTAVIVDQRDGAQRLVHHLQTRMAMIGAHVESIVHAIGDDFQHAAPQRAQTVGAVHYNGDGDREPPDIGKRSENWQPKPARTRAVVERAAPSPDGPPDAPQQKILDALKTYEMLGQKEVGVVAVSGFAGIKRGGYFSTAIRRLLDAERIQETGRSSYALTISGRKLSRAFPVKSIADVHAFWLKKCDAPQQKILRYLIHAGPDRSVTKAEVSEQVGIKQGGYFSTALKRLEDWGAMDVRGQLVVVSRLLYPDGLS